MSEYIKPETAIQMANNIRKQYGCPPYSKNGRLRKFFRPLKRHFKEGQTFYKEEDVVARAHHCAQICAKLLSYNRFFKKGDTVRVVEWHGRRYQDFDHGTVLKTGELCEVWEDEENDDEGFVSVTYQSQIRSIAPCFLEMVTPIEQKERYYIKQDCSGYAIIDKENSSCVAYFHAPLHPLAKEAAQIECSRLNAMHKEMQP